MNWRALPRRAFPYLIAAAGGFLIAYTAVFLFAFPAEVLPDDGILPNVVGKKFADAAAILQKAGFPAQQGESRFHKTLPANIVLQEDPPAGSRQKRGTNVVLALSAGQKTAEVPVTTNMSQQQARIAIENTGLTLGNVTEQLADQLAGLCIIQRRQRNGFGARRPAQHAAVFGPVGDQRERTCLRDDGQEIAQHGLTGLIDPVHVLDDIDTRC